MAITLQDKAQFYQKLYTGMSSGLTLDQLVGAQLLPVALSGKAAMLKQLTDRGTSIADAFARTGLVTPWEAQLIGIGEHSGRLETVFSRLKDFFATKVLQFSHIKAKLLVPMITMVVAITVLPLPAVAGGLLSSATYIGQMIASLLLMFLLYQCLLVKPFQSARIGAFNPVLVKSLALAGDENFLRLQFEVSYIDLLTLCLDSGMDAVQSLKLLQANCENRKLRRQHAFAISKIDKGGCSLAAALDAQGILKNPQVLSFLQLSEQSGTLHSDMREFVMRKKHEVDATTDYWIRRISVVVYIAVTGYAALKIVPLFLSVMVR